MIDEVHERSIDVDLVLLALRRALFRGGAGAAGAGGRALPKLILMSATVDAGPLSAYFGGGGGGGDDGTRSPAPSPPPPPPPALRVGVCEVEGRAFPVTQLYLEVVHS